MKFSRAYIFLFILVGSCTTVYKPNAVEYNDYSISQSLGKDTGLTNLIKPYSDSLSKKMYEVLAYAEISLEKKSPEGSLGNLLADIMLIKAREKFNMPIDAAVVNSGGIRLGVLQQGAITRGKIFELSPFDNVIVVLTFSVSQLKTFADHMASRGGWPIAGMSYKIRNRKAEEIKVAGDTLSENNTYTIAMPDYLANGGDDSEMLRSMIQKTRGYIFRDAIIEYMVEMNKAGKKIFSKTENRIMLANP